MQRSDLSNTRVQSNNNHFDQLPDETLERIYNQLKPSDAARFSRTCKRFRLFGYAASRVTIKLLLEQIIKGRRDEAMSLIKQDLNLLFEIGTVTDHAERTIENVTPLQLAFGAADADMFTQICFFGFKYLPNGYQAALSQLQDKFGRNPFSENEKPFEFTRLVLAISSFNESQGSYDELKNAYNEFLSELKPRTISNQFHFNFSTYIEALYIYQLLSIRTDLSACKTHAHATYKGKKLLKWNDQLGSFFWISVIGVLQRDLTAAHAQDLCQIINKSGFSLWRSQSLAINPHLNFFEDCLQSDALGVKYALGPGCYPQNEMTRNINGRSALDFIQKIYNEYLQRRMGLRGTFKILKDTVKNESRQDFCVMM